MRSDFKVVNPETAWQREGGAYVLRQVHVEYSPTLQTMEMPVLVHVGAKSRGASLDFHLPNHTRLYECIQTVVNRCHGDLWHFLLRAKKDFFRRWMILFLQQDVVNTLALLGETETRGRQLLAQLAFAFVCGLTFHVEST